MKTIKMSSKSVLVLLSVVLITAMLIGGTIAWIIARGNTVINTFTYGDIDITLTETDNGIDLDGNPNTNTYKLVPGRTVTKDPKVTVKAGSEPCYLFVKLEKSANYDSVMEDYVIAEGWTALDAAAYPGVYYRTVDTNAADQVFGVIKDNEVTMKSTVTKADLHALETFPKLTVTSCAVQLEGIATAAAAWEIAIAP